MERREDEVPGQRGLDGDLGGLAVTDLADHDHVGVGAHHRAQAHVERHARLGGDLHLLDAGDPLLDRILDREDAAFAGVEHSQRSIQRGRLARAGGAGHQHRAVRPFDRAIKTPLVDGLHAEGVQALDHRAPVQDAQDHALAVDERQGHHAYVHAPPVDGQPEAAVLW